MKATFEVPDDLYRRVKAKSALEGRSVRSVVVDLLTSWLDGRGKTGDSGKPSQVAKGQPAWFGSLGKYAKPGTSHDLDAIRSSIENAVALRHGRSSSRK